MKLLASCLYQDANSASEATHLNNQAQDVLSQFNTVNR